MSRKLPFPVFDADNHMYEKTDAFTRHLPAEYDGLVKFVEINGRTKIALNNTISEYIPNPTFQKVAPPGAQELQFRIENPSSKTEPGDIEVAPPPNYILAPDAFFEPEARVKLMDELSIDRAVMWPTLASLLEERLAGDPRGTHVVTHALNKWMLEDWTFNFDDRIYPTPVIAMNIVAEAIRELEFVVENGAKVVLIRPAPVPDFNGRRRSFALEEFDPFWEKVSEAGVVVGMHASDDGQQRYQNEWNGLVKEFEPFKRKYTAFDVMLNAEHRGINDVVTSIIGHGLATRFPEIRFMPVENGSAWVRPLVDRFRKIFDRTPAVFDEDPIVALTRNFVVHPFHEEDPLGLIDIVGIDNVVFGSDYPHPEGLFDPVTWVDELATLPQEDQAKVMGGNLARLIDAVA
ncbi:MAG: amidohydrolase family protein [Acidimicrobiales bacterium]|nr:amidohydrolase family protein [Acidimicrobiales bacterium]